MMTQEERAGVQDFLKRRFHELTWEDIDKRVYDLMNKLPDPHHSEPRVYGIPRGGSVVAAMLMAAGILVVDDPSKATIIVDDIIDSGRTAERFKRMYGLETVALVNKQVSVEGETPDRELYPGWVVFPWEANDDDSSSIDIVTRHLEYIGEDPNRDGLVDTPSRVVKAWDEIYRGYRENPNELLTWFEDDTDEMVVCKNIQFYSTCEHHMLPFFGTAAIGYIPTGKVLGISKLARIVDVYARRLQVQERLTRQVGEFLEEHTDHVAVQIEAVHMCMMARGVHQQNSSLVTNYLTGAFREPETRQEFLATVRG